MFSINDAWRFGPLYLLALSVSFSISVGGISTGLVLLAGAAVVLQGKGSANWPPRPILIALGLLLGSYLLSTILATPFPNNWGKLGEELWIKLLLVAIPVLATGHPRRVEMALKLALLAGALAAAYAVVQHFLGVDLIRDRSIYRPQFGHSAVSGFFSHHLSYAGQVLIFFLLMAAWVLDKPSTRKNCSLLPVLAIMGAALVWTFARSALLGAMSGLLLLILLQNSRRRWTGLAATLATVSVIFMVPAVRAHFLNIFDLDRHLTRINLWHSSWEGIKAQPILGFGPGNFEALLEGHQVPGHYETLGHAHNDLLMHGVNAGVPGILAALALLGTTCWLMFQARRTQTRYRWVFTGTLAVQAGITVAGFFQVFQTDDEVEMLLYFILGCAIALARNRESVPDPEQSVI